MADTIKVLVATDNHVGYAERDPIRGDDSWKTFHEIMCIAKKRDVDMVLLGGDLFHENKPSRKSMYNVMRSLRLNCYGDKPCELEFLSDGSEHFDSTIGHANYEDPDINVAIPVFSIHGNHDDPSGEGLYAALDILEMAGLINYFGRVPESDNITVKPLFFQKGNTKLAVYGLSNVRDERLHRTFRDNKVTFKRPGVQQQDWYNIMCVHQNHHAHTETSYLPEEQLPDYMDLVIWGHEHECDQIAHKHPEKGFRVLQPGSSVATSLVPGEAATKHVFQLNITGRECKQEAIRLKTVRPFVYKDIKLSEHKEAIKIAKKDDHRSELTRYLEKIVKDLIAQAHIEWDEAQGEPEDSDDEAPEFPLPIVRLRVETTSPDGGVTKFEVENPQRFSNRFTGQVANRNDVVQFFARKKLTSAKAAADNKVDAEILAKYQPETVKVEKLVRDFLNAQSLSILPTNHFGDAVNQFIVKDDKHAMNDFVNESLSNQIKNLVALHAGEEGEVEQQQARLEEDIDKYRAQLEDMFAQGKVKGFGGSRKYKPRPEGWDDDMDGIWEDQPGALIREEQSGDDDIDEEEAEETETRATKSTRGRGRGQSRGSRGTTTATRGRGRGAATTATQPRNRKKVTQDESDEDEDIVMVDEDEEDDDDDSQALFIPEKSTKSNNSRAKPAPVTASTTKTTTKKAPGRTVTSTAAKQSKLSFSQSQTNGTARLNGTKNGQSSRRQAEEIEDDEDDDAFEPVSSSRARRR